MPHSAAGMMMPGSNPYGPSGPPPPSLSGTPFSAPSGGMSGPPGGRVPHSMYPGSGPGPPSGSGSGPGVPNVGGVSHQQPHPPHPGAAGGGSGGPPTSKPSSVLNTVQLQQLSAQLKAYKLLARNVSPPEALISIVHGRKPTAAMLAALGKQQQQHQQLSHHGLSAPLQGDAQRGLGGSGGVATSEGGSGGNISLYPLSPNVNQGGSPANAAQSQTPNRTSLSLSQSTSSIPMSATPGGAPNVTISSSGELPLSVKQAMSAAQSRSSSTPPSGQQSSTPPISSVSPVPVSTQGPSTTTTATGAGQSAPVSQAQQAQQQQQTASGQPQPPPQQQQQMKAQLKSMKLAPPGKPQGIDPTVIIKEREFRYRTQSGLYVYNVRKSRVHCA